MGSPVTWFEINSSNPDDLYDFYARAFGWTMEPVPGMASATVDTGAGSGI